MGMVTLYYPTRDMIKNILAYSSIFDHFYVVDNTPHKDFLIINELLNRTNIIYIDNKKNMGIAYSLNLVIKRCKIDGCKWMLLMDQDSIITKDTIISLYQFANSFCGNNLAIVCASYHTNERTDAEEIIEAITSGSLVNVEICAICNYFDEHLYIDEVDNEYCLRIAALGYKTFRLNYAKFTHYLGNKKYRNGKLTYNYPPVRYYYLVRNALYVADKYQSIFPDICNEKRKRIKEWQNIILHEDNYILKKIFMFKGYIDYKTHKMGVCPWMNYK